MRKRSPSRGGILAAGIVDTILVTARKRGEDFLEALRPVAGPSPLQAAGMAH